MSVSSPRGFYRNKELGESTQTQAVVSSDQQENHKPRETLNKNNGRIESRSINMDEASTICAEESVMGEDGTTQPLDHCGLLPNNCLPFLASTASTIDKRRPISPGHPSFKWKLPSKLSFKWREGQHSDMALSEYCI